MVDRNISVCVLLKLSWSFCPCSLPWSLLLFRKLFISLTSVLTYTFQYTARRFVEIIVGFPAAGKLNRGWKFRLCTIHSGVWCGWNSRQIVKTQKKAFAGFIPKQVLRTGNATEWRVSDFKHNRGPHDFSEIHTLFENVGQFMRESRRVHGRTLRLPQPMMRYRGKWLVRFTLQVHAYLNRHILYAVVCASGSRLCSSKVLTFELIPILLSFHAFTRSTNS